MTLTCLIYPVDIPKHFDSCRHYRVFEYLKKEDDSTINFN